MFESRCKVLEFCPGESNAQESGFATLIPYWLLAKGSHSVSVSVRDGADRTSSIEFQIQVEDIPEGEGPWSLRRKMSQAEIELNLAALRARDQCA